MPDLGHSVRMGPSLTAILEHVADGLDEHAAALREGSVGTPEAQARWLGIQAENLRVVLDCLKARTL